MKGLGYGRGYSYAHQHEGAIDAQGYFPEEMGEPRYWHGVSRGAEKELVERLERIRKEKERLRETPPAKPERKPKGKTEDKS
jgi:putative ATPase